MKNILVTTPDKWAKLEKELYDNVVCGFDTEAIGPPRRYSQARDEPFLNVPLTSLQGVSVAFESENCYYLPVRHRKQNAKWKWVDTLMETLARDYHYVWAHNVKFDSRMVASEGWRQLPWRDSMLTAWMYYARGYGISLKKLALELFDRKSPEWQGSLIDKTAAEVLDYVCHDALNTLQVGGMLEKRLPKKLEAWGREVEYPLAHILGEMESVGVPINLEKLDATLGLAAAEKLSGAMREWSELSECNPHSSKSLQEHFEDGTWAGEDKTKLGLWKCNASVLKMNVEKAQTETGRKLAQLCLDIRESSKAQGTYVQGVYEELRQWPDRRLHPELKQTGTRTTRFSSANPNLQNQMARGELAPLLRGAYEAEPGFVFVGADYSQQEPRIFADMCGPGPLQDIFLQDRDIHQEQANSFGGTRDEGKTWNMGFLMYGGSKWAAHYQFGWELEEAAERIAQNFKMFPEGPRLRDLVIDTALSRDPWPYVKLKTGYRSFVKELVPDQLELRDHAEYLDTVAWMFDKKPYLRTAPKWKLHNAIEARGKRMALNTIIQGNGAAMTKLAMVKFYNKVRSDFLFAGSDARLVSMTHDDIWTTCREGHEGHVASLLEDCMLQAPVELGFKSVPFKADVKKGKTWQDLK